MIAVYKAFFKYTYGLAFDVYCYKIEIVQNQLKIKVRFFSKFC